MTLKVSLQLPAVIGDCLSRPNFLESLGFTPQALYLSWVLLDLPLPIVLAPLLSHQRIARTNATRLSQPSIRVDRRIYLSPVVRRTSFRSMCLKFKASLSRLSLSALTGMPSAIRLGSVR